MSYLRTTSGRLITTAAGIALTGGGIAALVGGSSGVAIMCLSLLLTISTSLVGAAMGTDKEPGDVILFLIVGPFALFFHVLAIGLAMEHAPQLGYGLGILGALALARAAFLSNETPSTASSAEHVTHATHAHG
jgi:hypothetical protein